ncbi:MAG: hypothetical protein HQ546_06185, partial [Planctomycetes bacterium]|nr:hypothetical protein [Planctomycetota bacterium]
MTSSPHQYNGNYTNEELNFIAFPLGGIGAGMICLDGTGAMSHVSLRHIPEVFNEPTIFSAICVKGTENVARVLEGPVPFWKLSCLPGCGNGAAGKSFGLPRFLGATFAARFPFATVQMEDPKVPLEVSLTGWSPFTPGDADSSSLPAAGLEYRFRNPTQATIEAVYSFHAQNFMARDAGECGVGNLHESQESPAGGFVLWQSGTEEKPYLQGAFSATVSDIEAKVNAAWFRGGWWDPLTMLWNEIEAGLAVERAAVVQGDPSPGGSLYVPFTLSPGGERVIRVRLAWYVPKSNVSEPSEGAGVSASWCTCTGKDRPTYTPWYAGRFESINDITNYWGQNYVQLRKRSAQFSDCFYDTTLPAEVTEAVSANLAILKSPTVLRQDDGGLWGWEGCCDSDGCCHGSCTHVWNYAQAIPHLFPDLERTMRESDFFESQDERGYQCFRTDLPIGPSTIRPNIEGRYPAAADGQLGGIIRIYREWRICDDLDWLKKMWPRVKQALTFCIETWDPDHKGVLLEPHHNTYDISFWGADGMCSSIYLASLRAAAEMAKTLGEESQLYVDLYQAGRRYLEDELFDGEYFYQMVQWDNLRAGDPRGGPQKNEIAVKYSPEAAELFEKEGPKYQYGIGCLSDGVLGAWLAQVCGVGEILDAGKVASHLLAVYKYNFKSDLTGHVNPQRSTYAIGSEAGLILCTWPKGGK